MMQTIIIANIVITILLVIMHPLLIGIEFVSNIFCEKYINMIHLSNDILKSMTIITVAPRQKVNSLRSS